MDMARVLLFFLFVCQPAAAFCFDAAGEKYHIDPLLIKAIARGESGLDPTIINTNRDKKNRACTQSGLRSDAGKLHTYQGAYP